MHMCVHFVWFHVWAGACMYLIMHAWIYVFLGYACVCVHYVCTHLCIWVLMRMCISACVVLVYVCAGWLMFHWMLYWTDVGSILSCKTATTLNFSNRNDPWHDVWCSKLDTNRTKGDQQDKISAPPAALPSWHDCYAALLRKANEAGKWDVLMYQKNGDCAVSVDVCIARIRYLHGFHGFAGKLHSKLERHTVFW